MHCAYQVQNHEISHDNLEARLRDYVKANENVAFFTRLSEITPEEAAEQFMTQWKNSPEHNKNLLTSKLTHSGSSVQISVRDNIIWYYSTQINANM